MALNGAVHFHCLSRFPLRLLLGVGERGTAGIRGWCGWRKADGSMDSRRVIVLLVLLLLTDCGHAEVPRGQDGGDQVFVVSEHPIPTSLLQLALRSHSFSLVPLMSRAFAYLPSLPPSCYRKTTMDPAHRSMPRPLGPFCAPCSGPWRDLAGVLPSCFSLRGEFKRYRSMAGSGKGSRKGRGLKKGD